MYGEDVDSATVRNSETGLQKFRSGNFDVDDECNSVEIDQSTIK